MSEAVSMIVKTALQQSPDQQNSLKSQTGGKKSFDDVMQNQQNQASAQNTNNQNAQAVVEQNRTTGISGSELDKRSIDLMNNVNRIDASQAPADKTQVFSEMIYTKTRMGMLKEAMNGVNTMPTGKEIAGRFSFVESEYKQIEGIMKSNKELSPGELLGLQARLYQVSQHIEVMSKVVDQVTGGIKTILNTNI